MSPKKRINALSRPDCLKDNNISRALKSYTDSCSVPNNMTDLLSNVYNISMFTNDNSSDSDDPFEDIAVSKNINFSRFRSYFGEDNQLCPLTPKSKGVLSSGKENQPMNSTPPSLMEDIQKKTNSAKQARMNSSKKHLCANELLGLKSRTPVPDLNKRDMMKTNQTSLFSESNAGSKQIFDLECDITFNVDANSTSKLGTTSTATDSSCDDSRNVSQNLNSEKSTRPTRSSSLLNSSLCQYTFTPTNKITPLQISSMKRYSLKKAAISAKKKFEDIVRNVMIQKSALKSAQKCSNRTFNANASTKQTNAVQCHSSLNFPSTSFISVTTADDASINKTPLRTRYLESSVILTGIKQLNPNTKVSTNHTDSQNVSHHVDVDDDLPPTQPLSSILLRGIVAYVEIKSGNEYRNEGVRAELESLGAKTENNFTKKVTHCFFHGGKMSTYRRAIERNVPLVNPLWIEACKKELQVVPLKGFEPYGLERYKEELSLYKLKTRIRRPVTESKLLKRPRQRANLKDKATQGAASICGPSQATGVESVKLVEALHSVAGDIKKASHQMEKILTSPILQKTNNQSNDCIGNPTQAKTPRNSKKRNKKLNFGSSSKDEQKKMTDSINSATSVNGDSVIEFRVSYDSDDMLAYAKKQAAIARASAPSRLITNSKCKKLLSSCIKQPNTDGNKNDVSLTRKNSKLANNIQTTGSITTRKRSKQLNLISQEQSELNRKANINENIENQQKTKKRKLLLPAQTVAGFQQDSRESTPDLSQECPYKVTPNKKQKTALFSKTKIARPLPPLISSDLESDDSLTRASRRESSALFVKKEKKGNPQRSVPTIVCTSLHRSDVEVVTSIVSTLGRFVVEATVSERTTHVITSGPRRTINLLKGIARGCWILNIKWVYESLESGKWLHEERFELIEFSPAVRQARVERQAFGPEFNLELFQGVGPIYVCRTTLPPTKDLVELIRLCGGTVVSNARVAKIIIGTSLPLSPSVHHPLMVKEKWVLDSISHLHQLDPRNYISVVSEP